MWIKQVFMAVFALGFGMIASAGVFTVLVSVGLIPRFADKFHIAKKILIMEEMVVFGTIIGGFVSIFQDLIKIGKPVLDQQIFGANTEAVWNVAANFFLILFGLFGGMFIGCLALAIAEMLDSIPIFTRRIGLRKGIGIVILAVALGKVTGSLIYFSQSVFLYGGT